MPSPVAPIVLADSNQRPPTPSGIASGSRIMLEHGRGLARKMLPRGAMCDRSLLLDSSDRHHLHHLAVILGGPNFWAHLSENRREG
jgi:hypothetical protein